MEYKAIVKRRTDDVQHWKYIRREYDFGKRRYKYYYTDKAGTPNDGTLKSKIELGIKDKLGYDEKAAYTTAKNTYDLHKDGGDYRMSKAKEILADVKKNQNGKMTVGDHTAVKLSIEGAIHEYSHLANAKSVTQKALSEYKKTPLYKIEKAKEKIDAGKKAVSKFFKRLFK